VKLLFLDRSLIRFTLEVENGAQSHVHEVKKSKASLKYSVTLAYFGYPVLALWLYWSKNTFLVIWLSNISDLSVTHKDYSRNASFGLSLISMLLLHLHHILTYTYMKIRRTVSGWHLLDNKL